MSRPDNGTILEGVVVSYHESADSYGGSYGEIKTDDGRCYTWNSGQVFRNFSFAEVGNRMRFTVKDYCYATSIDQIDKARNHARR